jgi:N-acetylglucosamine kinase-like BadF-type ATPase
MKVFAGIDSGGTRTRVALVREEGTVIGYSEGGSACFTDVGMDAARAELARLWKAAWTVANNASRPADSVFLGMGSILSEDDARINCEMATQLGFAETAAVYADNDAWNAHAGGLTGRPGILLISGTGSACLGRNFEGETWRAGGWGYLLNDSGSAHALGMGAMIAATRDSDGRSQRTRLTDVVRIALTLQDMKQIFRKVHHEGVSRAQVASLAREVVAAAEAGDSVARQLVKENVVGLVEMVITVAQRLRLIEPELALTGGLISHADSFRREFLEQLTAKLPRVSLARDGLAPVFGAVLLAFQRVCNEAPSTGFVENLRRSAASFSRAL